MKTFLASYPAVVRDVHDPRRSGRIRVECPAVYGKSTSPWCLPKHASHLWSVPYEGESVWISLRMGNPRYPVWEGRYTTWAEKSSPPEFYALAEGPFKNLTKDAVDHQNGFDDVAHDVTHAHEAGEFWNPYVHGLFFPMGGAFYVDEEPGEQKAVVRDRVGQYLRFEGDPIFPDDPHKDPRVGGEYDATDLDPTSELFTNTGMKARTRLQARHTQFLEMRVKERDGEEELELRSMNIAGTNGSHLTLSGSNLEHHALLERIEGGLTQSHVLKIDPNDPSANYQKLYDHHGQFLQLHSAPGDRYLRLQNGPGDLVELKWDDGFIQAKYRNGNLWKISASKVEIVTASGNVEVVSAANVTVNASSNVSVSAGGSATVNASSVSVSSGAPVTINGRAIALDGDPCLTPMGPGTVVGTGM
jgi:hypothetical protein